MEYVIDNLWNAPTEDLRKGYIFDREAKVFICLLCGRSFEKGVIYPDGEMLLEAEKAVSRHIESDHGGVFCSLIRMGKKYTGLSDVQSTILEAYRNGMGDAEIASMTGIERSTVRNHRFKMREKARQARMFLTLMEMAEAKVPDKDKLIAIHRNARMVDERYVITVEEERKILGKYFRKDGRLDRYPVKAKDQIVVLRKAVTLFEPNRSYSEMEVNHLLESIFEDYAIIRRNLIEHGFMEREPDGSEYRIIL